MLKLRSSKYLLVSKLRTKFQLTVIILSSAVYNLSECFYTTSRVGKTEWALFTNTYSIYALCNKFCLCGSNVNCCWNFFWWCLQNDLPHWLPVRQHQFPQAEKATTEMSATGHFRFSNINRINLINTCVVNSFVDSI